MRIETLPTLGDRTVGLRPQQPGDIETLTEYLEHMSVRRWFAREPTDVAVEDDPADPHSAALTIVTADQIAGWVLIFEESQPDHRHAALDAMLGPQFQGRGIGPVALYLVADWLFRQRRHHRLTIQSAVANHNALAAYHKLGFRDVGRLRQAHRRFDGYWEDSFLLEMLAGELIDPRS